MKLSISVLLSLSLLATASQTGRGGVESGDNLTSKGSASYNKCSLQGDSCASSKCCKGFDCDPATTKCKKALYESCKASSDCCSSTICQEGYCVPRPPTPKPESYPSQDQGNYPQKDKDYPPSRDQNNYPPQKNPGDDYPKDKGNQHPPKSQDNYPPKDQDSYPPKNQDNYPPKNQGSHPPQNHDNYPPSKNQNGGTHPPPKNEGNYPPPKDNGSHPPPAKSCRATLGSSCTANSNINCCKQGTCTSTVGLRSKKSWKCCLARGESGCGSASDCCTKDDVCASGVCSAPVTPPGDTESPPGNTETPPGDTETPPGDTETPPGETCSDGALASSCSASCVCVEGHCGERNTCCLDRDNDPVKKKCTKDEDCCTAGDICDTQSGVCGAPPTENNTPVDTCSDGALGSTCSDTCVCAEGHCGERNTCCLDRDNDPVKKKCDKDKDCCTTGDKCDTQIYKTPTKNTLMDICSDGALTSTCSANCVYAEGYCGERNTCCLNRDNDPAKKKCDKDEDCCTAGDTCDTQSGVCGAPTEGGCEADLGDLCTPASSLTRRKLSPRSAGCCKKGTCDPTNLKCCIVSGPLPEGTACTENEHCCTSGHVCNADGTCSAPQDQTPDCVPSGPLSAKTCKKDSDCCTKTDVCNAAAGKCGECPNDLGDTCGTVQIVGHLRRRVATFTPGCCKTGVCDPMGFNTKCCIPHNGSPGCRTKADCCSASDECRADGTCGDPPQPACVPRKANLSIVTRAEQKCTQDSNCCETGDVCDKEAGTCSPPPPPCVPRGVPKPIAERQVVPKCTKDSDCCQQGDICNVESGICRAPICAAGTTVYCCDFGGLPPASLTSEFGFTPAEMKLGDLNTSLLSGVACHRPSTAETNSNTCSKTGIIQDAAHQNPTPSFTCCSGTWKEATDHTIIVVYNCANPNSGSLGPV